MYAMPVFDDPLGTIPVELCGLAGPSLVASKAPANLLYVVQLQSGEKATSSALLFLLCDPERDEEAVVLVAQEVARGRVPVSYWRAHSTQRAKPGLLSGGPVFGLWI
mmetsp:Transcript_25675/g.78015  ORF Transcript_25675/g.78015 Transcript_25675/m.78015 type:complete len:107 (+) Transcript_25675:232-552(+)